MPKIDVWMPWYIASYIADTVKLTSFEHGAYMLLLGEEWRSGRIPDNMTQLVRLTRSECFLSLTPSIARVVLENDTRMSHNTSESTQDVVHRWLRSLLDTYFTLDADGLWFNARLEEIQTEWAEKAFKRVEKSKKAIKARWDRVRELQAQELGSKGKKPHTPSKKQGDTRSITQELLEPFPSPSPLSSSALKTSAPTSSSLGRGSRPRPASRSIADPVAAHTKGESEAKATKKALHAISEAQVIGKGAKGGIGGAYPAKIAKSGGSGTPKDHLNPVKGSDGRFGVFRDEIFRAYAYMYDAGLVRSSSPSWGPRERREMNVFLESNPNVDFPVFKAALLNWSTSDNANVASPPHKWLGNLMSFSMNRLDRFGRTPSKRRVY
jgi:uncharacterized protein YdaU (DUF1376 family)